MRWHVFVRGVPVTQGSITPGVTRDGKPYARHDNRANLKSWRHAIGEAVRREIGGLPRITGQPVFVTATFFVARPQSHYGTGRNAGVLKDSAPRYPTSKPDVDKLTRALLDALTQDAALYGDDSQVVDAVIKKRYADSNPPGVGIEIEV